MSTHPVRQVELKPAQGKHKDQLAELTPDPPDYRANKQRSHKTPPKSRGGLSLRSLAETKVSSKAGALQHHQTHNHEGTLCSPCLPPPG